MTSRAVVLLASFLFLVLSCSRERPVSRYEEVDKNELLALMQEDEAGSIPGWLFNGQCDAYYCFSEVYFPFRPRFRCHPSVEGADLGLRRVSFDLSGGCS